MAITAYPYSITNDLPGGAVDVSNLWEEISASGSGITIQLDDIVINPNDDNSDLIHIIFKDALSAGEKTALDGDTTGPCGGLIAAHDNIPHNEPEHVIVDRLEDKSGPEDSLRVYPAPNRVNFYRCDRDLKLKCGVYGLDSSEDLKIDNATNKQIPWNELTQVGIYYEDDNGDYIALASDSDPNFGQACLSIWDFHPHDQSISQNKIPWDIKGGFLKVAADLGVDKDQHRFYATLAPNIPTVNARMFDSYLERNEGGELESMNEIAAFLNPVPTPELTRLRMWVFYPPGSKVEHIFRLVTYRPLGTF